MGRELTVRSSDKFAATRRLLTLVRIGVPFGLLTLLWLLVLYWSSNSALTVIALLGATLSLCAALLLMRHFAVEQRVQLRWQDLFHRQRRHSGQRTRQVMRQQQDEFSRQHAELTQLRSKLGRAKRLLETFDRDLGLAERVQNALLEMPSPFPFCEVALIFEPLEAISGDVYRVAEADGRCRIFVGDAMGHGVGAALVTSMVQASLMESIASQDDQAVLTSLDRLVGRCQLDTYMTGCLATLEADGSLTLTYAGCPSPLMLHSDSGTVSDFFESGLPLGFGDGIKADFGSRKLQMRPSDRLLLFTDGLAEWHQHESSLDVSAITDTMQRCRSLGLQDWLDAIFRDVRERADGVSRRDDITVVALEFRAREALIEP